MTVINNLGLVYYVLTLIFLANCDIYLHNPRGSNNRINEKTATRKNANRLFDSQNNNRGGYNAGDVGSKPFDSEEEQYRMKYFQSGPHKTFQDEKGQTKLTIEWTNQHGCGGNENDSPQKQNCALILQYLCQDDVETATGTTDTLRNGATTSTQGFTKPNNNNVNSRRPSGDVKEDRGIHEPWHWYNKCYLRQRNKGLFTADQTLKNKNGAIYTRQNPDGNRYGYECPEERDYFPYWHPTPWTDIAVLAENASLCSHYTSKSFNRQPYGECIEDKGWSAHNSEQDCVGAGGRWKLLHNYLEKATEKRSKSACERTNTGGLEYKWAVAYDSTDYEEECLVLPEPIHCQEAPWSRSNHLGNGRDGQPLSYDWVLPYFPSQTPKRCVFRIRYNISTDDFDPYTTDYNHNEEGNRKSPVENNPYVHIMHQVNPLRLAINTSQYGRVFQDRSHVFKLLPRPRNLREERIYNLNVRGKRGNIVQVYPAVEYDFVPNKLILSKEDLIHIQWTGSNTHDNGGNGGDGQAGDDGQGKDGSDRNNFVELTDMSANFPTPFEKSELWPNVEVVWIYHGKTDISAKDLAINLASSGYYRCVSAETCPEDEHEDFLVSTREKMDSLLNKAPASYQGVMLKFTRSGKYRYMCTRNNNFTNRSQKATIVVT